GATGSLAGLPDESSPRGCGENRLPGRAFPWFIVLPLRRLDLFRQQSEPGLIVQGYVGQDFTVQRDSRHLQPVHELAVGDPVLLARGRDAHDPQRAEIALLPFTAGVGELEPALD